MDTSYHNISLDFSDWTLAELYEEYQEGGYATYRIGHGTYLEIVQLDDLYYVGDHNTAPLDTVGLGGETLFGPVLEEWLAAMGVS